VILCWLGFHKWRSRGGETLRDGRGKVRVNWQICLRHCGAMRARAKAELPLED
jgi:hypothetical protein